MLLAEVRLSTADPKNPSELLYLKIFDAESDCSATVQHPLSTHFIFFLAYR